MLQQVYTCLINVKFIKQTIQDCRLHNGRGAIIHTGREVKAVSYRGA